MADLSRLHAWIERDGQGHLLRAVWPATVDGRPLKEQAVLADGSRITLGQSLRLRFRQPSPLSTTARLDFDSPHRLSLSADAARVRELLANGADVNVPGRRGRTALVAAASGGHKRAVELLLERGAEIDARDHAGYTALLWAAYQGHTGCVEILLERGADPNVRAGDDCTPLTWAAYNGNTACVKALLDKSADPNVKESGSTALIWAIDQNHAGVVQLLLARGADPHEPADDGESPLEKTESPRIIRLLKSAMAGHAEPASPAAESETDDEDESSDKEGEEDEEDDEKDKSSRAAVAHLVGWGVGLFVYGVCEAGNLFAHATLLGIGLGIVVHALIRLVPSFSFLDDQPGRVQRGFPKRHAPHLGWGVGLVCYALTHSLDSSLVLSIGAGMLSAGIVSMFLRAWEFAAVDSFKAIEGIAAAAVMLVALVGSVGWLVMKPKTNVSAKPSDQQLLANPGRSPEIKGDSSSAEVTAEEPEQ